MKDAAPEQSDYKIMVIEDDRDIRELISIQLQSQGIKVNAFSDGTAALEEINSAPMYDLYMIDWMLPGISGIELCKAIRRKYEEQEPAILIVTALTQSENIVAGLDAGADDYITKPFDINVLQARVRAGLRRKKLLEETKNTIRYRELSIDINKCVVKVEDENIHLTSTEFKILSILASKPGHVFTREQLISQIQGQDVFVTNRTVDTHVAGLRKKIKSASDLIETIRGIGYRFKDYE